MCEFAVYQGPVERLLLIQLLCRHQKPLQQSVSCVVTVFFKEHLGRV